MKLEFPEINGVLQCLTQSIRHGFCNSCPPARGLMHYVDAVPSDPRLRCDPAPACTTSEPQVPQLSICSRRSQRLGSRSPGRPRIKRQPSGVLQHIEDRPKRRLARHAAPRRGRQARRVRVEPRVRRRREEDLRRGEDAHGEARARDGGVGQDAETTDPLAGQLRVR